MAFMFGHTVDMYAGSLSEELCNSPASTKKGLPLTISWEDVLVLRRCGIGVTVDIAGMEASCCKLA